MLFMHGKHQIATRPLTVWQTLGKVSSVYRPFKWSALVRVRSDSSRMGEGERDTIKGIYGTLECRFRKAGLRSHFKVTRRRLCANKKDDVA